MSLAQPMSSLMINGVHCLASCFRIVRADGVVIRVTDHNRALVVGGETYLPAVGQTVSARERQEGLAPQNLDASGALVESLISEEDIKAGRYRRATITERVVNWRWPWVGTFDRGTYLIRDVMRDGEVWKANVDGRLVQLDLPVGYTFEKRCRWRQFGDANCGFDLGPVTVAGEVTAIVTQKKLFETDRDDQLDDFYRHGRLEWTSGDNEGIVSEVKSYEQDNGLISLHVATLMPIQVGDTFDLAPGCDRRESTCKNYGVFPNFGGFPFLPGNDDFQKTPETTT